MLRTCLNNVFVFEQSVCFCLCFYLCVSIYVCMCMTSTFPTLHFPHRRILFIFDFFFSFSVIHKLEHAHTHARYTHAKYTHTHAPTYCASMKKQIGPCTLHTVCLIGHTPSVTPFAVRMEGAMGCLKQCKSRASVMM